MPIDEMNDFLYGPYFPFRCIPARGAGMASGPPTPHWGPQLRHESLRWRSSHLSTFFLFFLGGRPPSLRMPSQ